MSFSSPYQLTPAVKNLIIINLLVYTADYVLGNNLHIDIDRYFGLHYFLSEQFGFWQFVTFAFLHGSFSHLFFNMFAVFMFGRIVEQTWGAKKFLVYYFVTAIGSGLIQQIAFYFDTNAMVDAIDAYLSDPTSQSLQALISSYGPFSNESNQLLHEFINTYNNLVNTDMNAAVAASRKFVVDYQQLYFNAHTVIGASGAVFGILLAFGMLFPNMRVMLLIPPIPLKAKYLVIGYGVLELFGGIANSSTDNVAHWAHLGGMLFGFLLIKHWNERSIY
ncbi:MAG: rhomboid family intramembrane serine protease [Bacteroidales bacterium]|nr:rhomboid family intramembrane serine protease [Bacteroidales bacterium]